MIVFPDLKGKYISEAHSRNVNSFSPLIFTFIILSLILNQNISRNKRLSKKLLFFINIFTQIILILLKIWYLIINFLYLLCYSFSYNCNKFTSY